MATTEAQKRASTKWNSKNQVVRTLAFYQHKDDDMELLEHLDTQPNKGAYIKQLIRQDIDGSQCSDLSSDPTKAGRWFHCSKCDFGLIDYCSVDESQMAGNEIRYCPNCGAKVMRE